MASTISTANDVMLFQDVVPATYRNHYKPPHEESDKEEDLLSVAFFELANVARVGYRLSPELVRKSSKEHVNRIVVVEQDANACGQHTGGIVWETSYLLLNYLLSLRKKFGKTLEVGAGCGMLGTVLAASGWCKRVVLTEVSEALSNLEANVARNETLLLKKKDRTVRAACCKLDWLRIREDVEARPTHLKEHSFDSIIGTDVVFSPSLVDPLLDTMRYMAHKETVAYLCLQVRCADSYYLLLNHASKFQWHVSDITEDLGFIPSCAWGLKMECRLLKFTLTQASEEKATKKSKKRRDEQASNAKAQRRKTN